MNNYKITGGGNEKAIFNSVRSTYPGGVTIDKTGYTNPDNVIPAGTLVSEPDAATGLSKIVKITGADQFDSEPLGLVYKTVPLDDFPMVGVVTGGDVKAGCLPDAEKAAAKAIHAKVPTLIMTN